MFSNFPRTHQMYVVGPDLTPGGLALTHEATWPCLGSACNTLRWLGVGPQPPVLGCAPLSPVIYVSPNSSSCNSKYVQLFVCQSHLHKVV